MRAVVSLVRAAGVFGTAAMVFVGLLVGIMTVGEAIANTEGAFAPAVFIGAVCLAVAIFIGNGG